MYISAKKKHSVVEYYFIVERRDDAHQQNVVVCLKCITYLLQFFSQLGKGLINFKNVYLPSLLNHYRITPL